MNKIISALLCLLIVLSSIANVASASTDESNDSGFEGKYDKLIGANSLEINAVSAVLIDSETGTLLYEKNASEGLPLASVTKIMTLLLVAEGLERGDFKLSDKICVSQNAASKGGSQIFVKEGEEFTVEELLKSTVIASANDAAVALAELVSGSESAFAEKMNQRADELGMKNTHFENATGLDDTVTNHYSSAYDIAIMSRELIKHDTITKYSRVWQDSIRNGEFILSNTNRLVRYYDGCTGLKTGSTDKAGFCVSATAKRDGMHLIAVVMGAKTRDERNEAARALLDYGFSNFSLYSEPETELENIRLIRGEKDYTAIYSEPFSKLVAKSDKKRIEKEYDIPDEIEAPLKNGDVVGTIVYKLDGQQIGKCDIYVKESVDQIGIWELFVRIVRAIVIGDIEKK